MLGNKHTKIEMKRAKQTNYYQIKWVFIIKAVIKLKQLFCAVDRLIYTSLSKAVHLHQ